MDTFKPSLLEYHSLATSTQFLENITMSNILGRTLGSYVVSPIVECVDVDGVIRRVDVNDVVARIDIEALLDRVDLNRVLNRVDMNALLERVDVEQLVERTNLEYIVARSSTSICDSAISTVRAILVQVDQLIQACCRLACFRSTVFLPPRPGNSRKKKDCVAPQERMHLAVALQGRYAGGTLQTMAWWLDQVIISIMFSIAVLLVQIAVRWILDDPEWSPHGWRHMAYLYATWSFLYFTVSLAATGRSVGLALYGLMVVKSGNGEKVDLFRAAIRTSTFPVSVASIIGVAIMWIRRDGRSLADLLACTGTIYSWDARMALMRANASSFNRGRYRDRATLSLNDNESSSDPISASHT